jgi:3-dehydroquinate synthase
MYQVIDVDLGAQSYPIYIGQNCYVERDILARHIHGRQVMIVTQEKIAQHYLPALQKALVDYHCDVCYVPDGEAHKNLQEWQNIIDALLHSDHERSTTIIALGGGMIGDLAGFAAACYLRGVKYLQIPTTLIAQVDAAIGGKTAVNHVLGKNLVGIFYQPQCVIADINTLMTLSQRDYVSGLAEVIKYALICDARFFVWLEENMPALLARESSALLYAIDTSARIKARIVEQDEKEQGLRSLLNLGHTFGHALETAATYSDIRHGEAVGVGLLIATQLSADLGWLAVVDAERVKNLLAAAGFKRQLFPLPEASEWLRLMRHDKKTQDGKLNLILLKKIGEAVMTSEVREEQVKQVLGPECRM